MPITSETEVSRSMTPRTYLANSELGQALLAGEELMAALIQVAKLDYGQGVFATDDLPAGTIVATFSGPILPLSEVPKEEINYVVRMTRDTYMIPDYPARLFNHSCSPNCEIDDHLNIVVARPVRKGEQLTFAYNRVTAEEAHQWGTFWHPGWTFQCRCGGDGCIGLVDRYQIAPLLRDLNEHMITESPSLSEDIQELLRIARLIGTFTDAEVECLAMDIAAALRERESGEACDFLMTIRMDDRIIGFTQSGPIPMTNRSWMLYWILLTPEVHGMGIGPELIASAERRARQQSARLMLIETSDQLPFAAARRLYEKCGYELAAQIGHYYDLDHAKCIYRKIL